MGIVREMERTAPNAVLLNYTNPMHKLCEAATRLTNIQTIGLCHGVFMGLHQISNMLELPVESLDAGACGINHFTWFQWIRNKQTGEDLYPRLRELERTADPLADWHEIGLSRILFRRFGLYPSPGTNHIGEYIGWADEFYASELHYYYDPMDGHPWETGVVPEFVYSLGGDKTTRPLQKPPQVDVEPEEDEIRHSGEGAVAIMESLACGISHDLPAINIPNKGYIPGVPEDACVEVPATGHGTGIVPAVMDALPEPVTAMVRTQCSIQKLLVEAYAEESREKLLQALLLEPMVDSYRKAVEMMDEMLRLQKDILPPLH
jgi:alpha-galactosidase